MSIGLSRFSGLKLPYNIYQNTCFYQTTIHDRFFISKTLFRNQNYNLHLGIDLSDKSEVIIISTQERIYNKSKKEPKVINTEFISEVIWQGIDFMNKCKYMFFIYKKQGCLLIQLLSEGIISIEKLYIILFLLLQVMHKIHKLKANLNILQLKSLQLIDKDDLSQSVIIKIYQQPCLTFKYYQQNYINKQDNWLKNNIIKKQLLDKNTKQDKQQKSYQLFSNKNDIIIILNKILQISNQIYQIQSQDGSIYQFHKIVKQFLKQSINSKFHQQKIVQRYRKILTKIITKNKIQLQPHLLQIRNFIRQKKKRNKMNLLNFCVHYQKFNLSQKYQSQNQFENISIFSSIDSLTNVNQYINDHILDVQMHKNI